MKLSEMRQILAEGDIQLTKSLGQNFLHDANQLEKIVQQAELGPGDRVLEVGPGLGPLTERLLGEGREVLAIEKDARLVSVLRHRFANALARRPGLTLVHGDALGYVQRERRDWRDWKLVANLPYSVASPILVELAQGEQAPQRIVVTLQLEVARRLAAGPDHADYGVLTLLVQRDFVPAGWFKIPPGSFFPEPDVDSACVTLVRRDAPVVSGALRATFTAVVKRAFSQRRKMMLKLLKQDWPPDVLAAGFAAAGIPATARAEHVSLEAYAQLTRHLAASRPPTMPTEIFDVVNERDEVIDRRPRAEVHRLGLMHRAAHIFVQNARGEVFLQKRSMKKDRQPGLWDSSASGHVDSGEDYDASAVRELREELGHSPAALPRRLFKVAASGETDQEHVWVYACAAEGPFELHPEEIDDGRWLAPEEISRWMAERPQDFAGALRAIWPRVRAELEQG